MDDNSVPGFTASPELEAKLDSLDDNLLPKDRVSEEPAKDEPAKPEEEPKETEKDPEAEEKPEETDKDSQDPKSTEEVPAKDGEGYTIDEGETEKPTSETLENTPERSQLSPEQQYIIDSIQPITVRGVIGSDEKVQEFKVYSPEQLPDGFKYTDDKSSAMAAKSFAMLESKATELQTEFRNQETQKSAKAFKEAEDSSDRAEIGRLQREGEIPKFKVEPEDPNFEKDPAAVLIQEVLDFKEKKNAEYLEAANAGRPYKHIGFEEAFLMYRREQPTNPAQDKEDQERKDLAERTGGAAGAKSDESPKPRVHSGMGSMDLDRLIEDRTKGW